LFLRLRLRRTSVRSSAPTIPKPAKDLYDRLFWYGFDPDDSEAVGDKTVFGGTKGKFNGLSYLAASEQNPGSRRNRRQLPSPTPPPKNNNNRKYYDDDDEEDEGYYYEDENENESISKPQAAYRPVKPPNDVPYPRSEVVSPPPSRATRRRRRRADDYDDDYDDDEEYAAANGGGGEWISKQVSSWFRWNGDEQEEDDDYNNNNNRGGRRQQRRDETTSRSPFNVLDAFFGVDRQDLEYKRDKYNEQMGIGSRSSGRSRRQQAPRRSPRDDPRRPGYAYRYNDEDEEDSPPVADIDTTAESLDDDRMSSSSSSRRAAAAAAKPKANEEVEEEAAPQSRTRERTWEERALAVEQVPPADIVAWGPSGELGMDARTKAILDALEDTQTARQKLEAKEKKEALAREDITILKV
jgi:hypothetical protein